MIIMKCLSLISGLHLSICCYFLFGLIIVLLLNTDTVFLFNFSVLQVSHTPTASVYGIDGEALLISN